MLDKVSQTSARQRVFSELFINTLLYVAVLGLFNDYTEIVYAKSFSYLFLASVIMGILTFATFWLKGRIVARYGKTQRLVMAFGVWLVMFLSKFVFVWAIDLVFGDNVSIYGYFGIVAVIMSVTIANKITDFVYEKLT